MPRANAGSRRMRPPAKAAPCAGPHPPAAGPPPRVAPHRGSASRQRLRRLATSKLGGPYFLATHGAAPGHRQGPWARGSQYARSRSSYMAFTMLQAWWPASDHICDRMISELVASSTAAGRLLVVLHWTTIWAGRWRPWSCPKQHCMRDTSGGGLRRGFCVGRHGMLLARRPRTPCGLHAVHGSVMRPAAVGQIMPPRFAHTGHPPAAGPSGGCPLPDLQGVLGAKVASVVVLCNT